MTAEHAAREGDTRERMLDAVEHLMVAGGYAAVTYRAVAAEVGVTAGSVQYWFPTLDDLFTAAIRRRIDENLGRLQTALGASDNPLRVLWDYSTSEASRRITTEFMALANHRKSIKTEIHDVTARVRDLEFAALADLSNDTTLSLELSPRALIFLMTAIPKLLQLEQLVDIDHGHSEIVAAIERYLDSRD
jgi:TetR/AcrR family transcriptional repressor of nem operon